MAWLGMSMVRFSLKLCPFAMTTGMSREAVNDFPIVHAMWQMIRDQQQGSPSEVEAPEALVDHDDSDGDPPEPEQARNVRRRDAEQQFVRPPAPPAVPPPVDVSKLTRPPPPPAPWRSAWAPSAPSAPSSEPKPSSAATAPSSAATAPPETELVSRVVAEVLAQIQRGAPNP